MEIQWFPGHMTKSVRAIEESVKLCDGVIYICDARAPFACMNNMLSEIFGNKPVIYVLNKADLVSESHLSQVKNAFSREGKICVAANGTIKKDVNAIYDKLMSLFSERVNRARDKGVFKSVRAMVAGVPNTGKSTIINTLCGEKRAVTGDKAGVTRAKQWVKLKDIELLDTPGTMPPKFENQYYARHLAYIGSINDAILDAETLCLEFIAEMKEKFPDVLSEKYSLKDISDKEPLAVYDDICKTRGFLFKGGEYDYERGARAVLDDFRKGRIGKICLETERFNG